MLTRFDSKLFPTLLFLLFLYPFSGFTQGCFSITSHKGDDAFKKGLYNEAIEIWQKAKKCSDKPFNNDLDIKINQASHALKQKKTVNVITSQKTKPPKKTAPIQPPSYEQPSKDVVFVPVTEVGVQKTMENAPSKLPIDVPDFDSVTWLIVKETNTIESYKAYLAKYPNGKFANDSKIAAQTLTQTWTLGFHLVKIEGGTFDMGTNDPNRFADERPMHPVILRGYFVSKYEITQAQWKDVMKGFPDGFVDTGCPDCPMSCVSWYEVQDFLRKLNEKTGKNYRLPTEAEWEYAAKGGQINSSYFYAGANDIDQVAWYAQNTNGKVSPVGRKKSNALGLHDLTGNVQEWCQDFYNEDFYRLSPRENPLNLEIANTCSVRGSSFADTEEDSRLTFRISENPAVKSEKIGFRIALSEK